MKRVIITILVVFYAFGQGSSKLGIGISLGSTSGVEAKIGNKWEGRFSLGYYGLLGRKKEFLINFSSRHVKAKYRFNIGLNVLSYVVKNFQIKNKFIIGVGAGIGYRQFWGYKHSYPELDVEYIHTSEKVIGFYVVPLRLGYKINNYKVWFEGGFYLPSIYEASVVSFSPLSDKHNTDEFIIRIGISKSINL